MAMDDRFADVEPVPSGALDAVHAPLLMFFREVVEECGGDSDRLLWQAGVHARNSDGGSVGYSDLARLLELSAKSLNRPDFGMLLALRQCNDGIEGTLGHAMRHARCFDEVLALAVKHSYAHSLASSTWLHRSASGRWVLLGHDIVSEGAGGTPQLMEQILLIGHLIAIRLTGGAVRSRRILLRHGRISPPQVYRRYFGCEVRFDERVYATVYRTEDMTCPIMSADISALREDIAAIEQRFAQKQLPLSRKVRATILHALDEAHCTGEWVAHQLDLHIRSLHRHLAREGTSFRRIKDEVRRDLAGYYLRETDLDMKSISERLGFSEQSALSRRTRAWFDGSPTDLRSGRLVPGRLSDRVKSRQPGRQ
jgi:AraC-like DNA-binding protein